MITKTKPEALLLWSTCSLNGRETMHNWNWHGEMAHTHTHPHIPTHTHSSPTTHTLPSLRDTECRRMVGMRPFKGLIVVCFVCRSPLCPTWSPVTGGFQPLIACKASQHYAWSEAVFLPLPRPLSSIPPLPLSLSLSPSLSPLPLSLSLSPSLSLSLTRGAEFTDSAPHLC